MLVETSAKENVHYQSIHPPSKLSFFSGHMHTDLLINSSGQISMLGAVDYLTK